MTDYLDGEMQGEALKTVETHLAQCSACRQFVEDLKQAVATPFKEAEEKTPSERVWANIRESILQEQLKRKPAVPERLLDFLGRVFQPKPLAVLVPVMAVILLAVFLPLQSPVQKYEDAGIYLVQELGITGDSDYFESDIENGGLGTVVEEFFM